MKSLTNGIVQFNDNEFMGGSMKSYYFHLSILIIVFSSLTLAQNSLSRCNSLYSVTFVDKSTGWSVGDDGTILKSTDGGSTWSSQNNNTAAKKMILLK